MMGGKRETESMYVWEKKQETKRTFCSFWKCVQTEAASFIKNLLQAVN